MIVPDGTGDAGCSLSLLRVDDARLRWLDAATSAPAWPGNGRSAPARRGRGAEETARMKPRLGRASYLGERAIGVPDAGAAAVVVWLKALAHHIG